MQEEDGIEICKRLKSNETIASIPVLLIMESEKYSLLEIEGLHAGADECAIIPSDKAELAKKINLLLRIKRSGDNMDEIHQYLQKLVSERTGKLLECDTRYKLLIDSIKRTAQFVM